VAAASAESFDAYYRQVIRPALKKLERRRKHILLKILAVMMVVCVLIAGVAAFLVIQGIHPAFAAIGLIPGLVVFAVAYGHLTHRYKAHFKEHVIGSVVRFFDPSLNYDPGGRVSESKFRQSGLFQASPDRYGGEDRVSGQVGKTHIEVSEVHAEYESQTTDADGNTQTSWHTIFKGLFFVGDFNKHIKGTTVVLPDVAERLLGRFGKMLQNVGKLAWHPELITLEDPEFEKYFVVYGDDQNEARYILTPNLMERIVSFRKLTGHGLHLSFRGQSVYVAITSGHDMFEPRVFRTVWSKKLIKTYVADMAMAIGVVEELNLNRRVWTKR
jgi:hypothetical protein